MKTKLDDAVAVLARAMTVMDAAVAGLNAAVVQLAEATAPEQEGAIQPARAGITGGEVNFRVTRKN
jgi:hypothetical protein